MSDPGKQQYEAMFIFDPTFAASFENCEAEVQRLMERAEGEILLCRRWDERRLAYRIAGRKRGTYVLTYFNASPSRIRGLERDATLAEPILRMLVVRADGVTRDMMERWADAGAQSQMESGSEDAEDDRRSDRPRRRRSRSKEREHEDDRTSRAGAERSEEHVVIESESR